MSESFVSRKAKEAQLYPKSSGESANNENQIITPFKWKNNADKTEVIVSLKDKYVFNISDLTTLLSSSAITSLLYRPPIGIPVFWFSSVPDWALAFDDGSGPYDWEDYPELDNTAFKAILTTWSTAGWMAAYDGTSFYVPDLRGMFPRLAGTNAVRNSRYAGGSLGAYGADQMQRITGNFMVHGDAAATVSGAFTRTKDVINDTWGSGTGDTDRIYFNSANSPNARTSTTTGGETRPAYFALRLVVRFE